MHYQHNDIFIRELSRFYRQFINKAATIKCDYPLRTSQIPKTAPVGSAMMAKRPTFPT
jgi:hypothetical protein